MTGSEFGVGDRVVVTEECSLLGLSSFEVGDVVQVDEKLVLGGDALIGTHVSEGVTRWVRADRCQLVRSDEWER